ncbi:penicillin-binding protein [Fusobacterium pseudoperiodonticum]|uniref:penicillin-binding protein n=1 Tax=Fusobacterium pseudoperiodonticum TaxID=2663009 RepID=UPI0028E67332|nr:penicillin-binding protein [Fusobacterium pseudoperiodonticum]
MYYIYSKEKLPKLLFDVNLTSEEVKLYGGWDVIFGYYPNIQKDNSTIIERDTPFNYPIFDNNTIREMTRDEKVANDIEITLEVGEFIENKKLIKVPKPQGNDKYLNWNSEKHLWILDTEAQRKDYFNTIDSLKAEVLDYGFDYKVDKTEHRQRCRDTDISKMVATVVALQLAKNIGADKKITWYFEDNFGMNAGLQELGMLMLFGTTFIQSVYDTENFFKTKENPKELTKDEFEKKRKEIHSKLAKG